VKLGVASFVKLGVVSFAKLGVTSFFCYIVSVSPIVSSFCYIAILQFFMLHHLKKISSSFFPSASSFVVKSFL
jgi:hypothetical protein